MMANSKTAKAFAKVNLTLDITGRRADGYHTLRSVMQSISLCNRVQVTKNNSGAVSLMCDDPALPLDEKNTAYRAAQAFLAAINQNKTGLLVTVQKRIPYQAGLGSASADAAGVLAACNALFDFPLSQAALLDLGAQVGADVPFCLMGGTKLAEGIGEILTPLPPCPDCTLLVLHPGEGVSTPEAYRRFDALTSPVSSDCRPMLAALAQEDVWGVATSCGNVFEQCCPVQAVAQMKNALTDAGALGAAMSGSGTAVFGIFEDDAAAGAAQQALLHYGWKSWLAHPVSTGVVIE